MGTWHVDVFITVDSAPMCMSCKEQVHVFILSDSDTK